MLLFPCNQFMSQEPDSQDVIKKFAGSYLDLTQPEVRMYSKSNVNSPDCTATGQCEATSKGCCATNNDVFDYLRQEVSGKFSWNFNKQLVYPNGTVYPKRFSPLQTTAIETAIDGMLASMEMETATM